MSEESSELDAGFVVSGRYEISETLGLGAFARVLRAKDRSTGRDVALKISRRAPGEERSNGFEEELRACARVSHPNVAGLLDAGTTPRGNRFLVFEYIAGRTLRSILDERGALEPRVALRLLGEILDALGALHRQGIVHRDVKPENIMIACPGVVEHAVLLDLGLGALLSNGDGASPATGELAGTPRYAAPEQIRGEAATPRADLYSWGLVLIECLTGRSAIDADSAPAAAGEQLRSEPVSIPASLEKTPLGWVLGELTQKIPERRPDSAARVFELLAQAVPSAGLFASESAYTRAESTSVTVLSARLAHPVLETTGSLPQGEYDAVMDLCRRGGGGIVSAVGDRITAVFGLRHRDDRDAQRALEVASALALRPATWVGSDAAAWSIGVHSGEIELRAASGGFDAVEALLGTTCAKAATLDEAAPRGRVLISAETENAVHDLWVTRAIGAVFSARPAPSVDGYLMLRRRGGESQFLAGAPMTGRLDELELIGNAWKAANTRGTHALFLTGQAGIGKSRLVRETRRIATGADWLEFRCTIERQTVPLGGLVGLVQTLGADAVTLARHYGLPGETIPILATLLGESMPEGFSMPPVTPERYRELVTRAALQLLTAVATDGPTVIVAEDLHWADASTLDFISQLATEVGRRVESGEPLPLLLLLTSRSEFAATWHADGLVRIDLEPMPASEVQRMIHAGLPAAGSINDDMVAELVQASAGLPLFVEQATRLISKRLAADSGDREMPRSMESVLAAQIDLLGDDARAVAQVAAAIGHYFDSTIVGAATYLSLSAMRSALAELAEAGVASASAGRSRSGYAFTHILMRDAAYRSVPEAERPALHRRIASAMQREHPEVGMQRPAELALQLELAQEPAAAAELWHRSGMQALGNAGYPEACEDLARGIGLLEPLPDSPERTMRMLGLTTALGSAHVMTKGFSAPEARHAFQTASRLCRQAGRDIPLEVLGGLFGAACVAADREEIDAVLPHFRALSQRTDSALFAFSGHQVLSVEAYWNGRIDEAWQRASTSMELYRRESVVGVAWEFGFGIHCYAFGMLAQFHRGNSEEAEAIRLEMLERAQRNGDPHCVAVALGWSTILLLASGRAQETIDESNRLIRLAGEQHLPLWAIYATISRGTALAETGQAAAAVPEVRHAMGMLEAMGAFVNRIGYSPYWARTLLAAGDVDGALEAVRLGMQWCSEVWTRIQEPELVRLHGVLLERQGRNEEAHAEFRRALTIARADGNVAAQRWILASAPALAATSPD